MIQLSLNTTSLETALIRRDALEEADDRHWAAQLALAGNDNEAVRLRYEAARQRAMALGFPFRSLEDLIASASFEEITQRYALDS